MPVGPIALLIGLSTCLTLSYAQEPSAGGSPPQVSKDGLQLKSKTAQRIVYVKPGATFAQYQRVAILDCYVEFQKGWEQSYNSAQVNPAKRVTSQDVDRMKTNIAAEFKKVFTEELQVNGGYQVVDVAAPDVLVLRPAILNVQVTAPDMMTPGIDATVVNSAGSATLYLELWDSASNTLLARALDAQADRQPYAKIASGVTNRSAADTILKYWATDLRKHLDAVRGKT
jgi:hypothetical protein